MKNTPLFTNISQTRGSVREVEIAAVVLFARFSDRGDGAMAYAIDGLGDIYLTRINDIMDTFRDLRVPGDDLRFLQEMKNDMYLKIIKLGMKQAKRLNLAIKTTREKVANKPFDEMFLCQCLDDFYDSLI